MTFELLVCKQCIICRSLWNRDNQGKETVSSSNITVGKLAMMMKDLLFFFSPKELNDILRQKKDGGKKMERKSREQAN